MTYWLLIMAAVVVVSFLSVVAQVQLWQRKEYRWDRLRALLASPEWKAEWTWLLVAAYLATLLMTASTALAPVALLLFGAHHLAWVYRRGVRRPVWTLKSGLITAAALILVATGVGIVATYHTDPRSGVVLVAVIPLVVAAMVALVNIPAAVRKRGIIRRAGALRQQLPALTVIGITGSFGKTSTKQFAHQLLSPTGVVAATKLHRNSEIGVAVDMLEQLGSKTQLYLTEMGAYRPGEIAALVRLTRPSVGVITGIGSQHLELFGSTQAILETKWELIAGLPVSGRAVLSGDDVRLRERAKNCVVPITWYSLQGPADVWLEDATFGPRSVTGTLHLGATALPVTIPVAGEGLAASALAATAIAHVQGVSPQQIGERLATITVPPATMEIIDRDGYTIIDDGYSANEHGVLQAIAQLARFSEPRKVVVLTPIIELGSAGEAVHERIGAAAAEIGATVYVYGMAYNEALARGMRAATGSSPPRCMADPAVLGAAVQAEQQPGTVILLEGRLPESARRSILGKPNL